MYIAIAEAGNSLDSFTAGNVFFFFTQKDKRKETLFWFAVLTNVTLGI
jgi:hypothetical protein